MNRNNRRKDIVKVSVPRKGHRRKTISGYTSVRRHHTTVYKKYSLVNRNHNEYKKYYFSNQPYKVVYKDFEDWGSPRTQRKYYLNWASTNKGVPELTFITPEEFLWGATDQKEQYAKLEKYNDDIVKMHDESVLYPPAVKKYMEQIKSGEPLSSYQLPFLVFDEQKKQYTTSHEGRHRALAAKKLGIKVIPVVIYHSYGSRDENEYRNHLYQKNQMGM